MGSRSWLKNSLLWAWFNRDFPCLMMMLLQSVALSWLATYVEASAPSTLANAAIAHSPLRGSQTSRDAAIRNETSATAKSGTDIACGLIESAMQGYVTTKCKTQGTVTCVWGNTAKCSPDDYCKVSSDCGYVEDNPFVKFDGYQRKVTDAAKLYGTVTCNPTLTPLTVGLIVAACFVVACVCFTCIWCCCCRRRDPRHLGSGISMR